MDTDRARVNSENYIQLLDDNLLPDCRRLNPRNNHLFHQNGAPSHTNRVTQAHLEEATQEFIKEDECQDCNPMDYGTWDSLKEKVYRGMRDKLTEQALTDRIILSWGEIYLFVCVLRSIDSEVI